MEIFIGCAGWQITPCSEHFREGDSCLARYATVFNAVEINSTFKRLHKKTTFARWRDSVPAGFRFAVKLPKEITHVRKLKNSSEILIPFLAAVSGLENKLGPLLIQLPPKLVFERETAKEFFDAFRARFQGAAVCEPRHASWGDQEAEQLLRSHSIGKVAADPAPYPGSELPSGSTDVVYRRLHGSPKMYYSSYSESDLLGIAEQLVSFPKNTWCIFDNTAARAAIPNALMLQSSIRLAGAKILEM